MCSLHDAAGAGLPLESYTRSGIWPNGTGDAATPRRTPEPVKGTTSDGREDSGGSSKHGQVLSAGFACLDTGELPAILQLDRRLWT